MRVVRKITYESDSLERLQGQVDKSLTEGVHNFGNMRITVETLDWSPEVVLGNGVSFNWSENAEGQKAGSEETSK